MAKIPLVSIAIFFGFIVLAEIVLLIVKKLADKYLNGDFIALPTQEMESEEEGRS